MKIDNRYEIRVILLEINRCGVGDIYDSFEEFKKEHPFSSYGFGYIVFDTQTNCIPEKCNDWNDSPEEAMMDYFDNCQ